MDENDNLSLPVYVTGTCSTCAVEKQPTPDQTLAQVINKHRHRMMKGKLKTKLKRRKKKPTTKFY
jgi:hypothetical protein